MLVTSTATFLVLSRQPIAREAITFDTVTRESATDSPSALAMSPSGPDGTRMVFIHSTLKMEHALLSEGLLNDARANGNLETLSEPSPLRFGSDGYVDLESYFTFGH